MRILGEDGDGYELTVRLENAGSLREWLGAASYAKLMPYLASKAAWHSFMNSTSTALLNLQMRVRALLFDKAAGCVYEDFGDVVAPSSLNPSYLQLNGNSVYFPLDQDAEDFKRYQATASRTPTTPLRHQSYMAKGQASQGQHSHNGSRRNLEDSHETKSVGPVSQQRHAPLGGHTFNSMMSSKQETSKPSLNKVKKVEAWDSNDATKRPMEMIGGTINKKLRSPKISSKATFQTDGTGVPVRDHQDKMGSHKNAGGSARSSDESSKLSTAAGMGRVGHATDTGDVGPLWYDQCAKTYLSERMQRLAQRAAQQKLPFPEREGLPRTPEGMVAYIEFTAKRQKTMSVVKPVPDSSGTLSDGQTARSSNEVEKAKGDPTFVPDLKFLANCVPDNPVPAKRRRLERCDHKPKGILDNLSELELCSPKGSKGTESEEAQLVCQSRLSQRKHNFAAKKDLGLLPDSSESEGPANKVREYGADQMLRQTVAKLVADAGFEGLKQSSLDLFVDVLDSRFKRLSTGMRVLIDSYRRQCSQAEYLKMFIQISDSSMEDMMEQVKVGVQKQQLEEKQRLEQRLEQEQLQLQKQEQEEELLLQQRQQREELQQQKQQEEQQEQQEEQEMLQQEDQLLKQRQAEETQSHQQQQQNPQKQRPLDQHPSPRRTDLQHSQQQQQQPQQKVRQPEKQPLQSPQHQHQQPQKQRQVDQQHSQQHPQQYLQKQRQPDYQQSPQQQQQQSSHFPSHKRKPPQTQSPSGQGLAGKPASMRSPSSAPSAIDTVLKQARKACSETMEQHKQKADQVMGLIKQHPQKMSQMSMLAHAQRHAPVGSPTKVLLTKSPDAYSGLLHQRQSVPQQTSADKAQKRKQQQASMGRHSPNIGRNQKKGEKERALDGKPIGETRPVVGKKAMQMMSGGNSSSWHPSIPIVKSQTSPMLQHMKQQAPSLQP